MTTTIRPVAAGDVHAIAELQVRAWRAEHEGFVAEADMPTLDDRIGLWNGVRPGEAWLAQDDAGAIVGVVGVVDGEVGVLHVAPELLSEDPAVADVDGELLRMPSRSCAAAATRARCCGRSAKTTTTGRSTRATAGRRTATSASTSRASSRSATAASCRPCWSR
jgi:hypothetical protein